MTRLKLSPDILALNPELAAQQAKSRAKTESGIGHGHTDDATHEKYVSPAARKVLTHIMKNTLAMMRVWGSQWEGIEATVVREAIKNYIKKVERSL